MQVIKQWKTILLLAVPSVVSFATMTLSGTLNLIIVGQMGGEIGALVIAVVGVSNIVIYNAWALFSGLGHTVNYLVAQNYGAGEMDKGIRRMVIALTVAAGVSCLVLVVGLFGADDILRLIGGEKSKELLIGEQYLRIRFFAMACGIMTFVFHGFFRGIGDTKTPMILSLTSNIVMVFLTYALTFGHFGFPEWGLAGAGWAFFTGEAIGLLGCLYVYFIRLHPQFGTRTRVKPNRTEVKLILGESGKLGIQEFSLSVSMLIFTMFVAYLGPEALAANEIALNVMAIGFMPAFAFGSTATILVGQEVGRGKPFAGRRYGTHTAILGLIFLFVMGTLEFFFATPIARIFSDVPEVYELAAFLIMISAFLQLFDGLLNFYAGGLRGIGDTSFLLVTSFILGFGVFVPLAYLAVFVLDWGSVGAWLSLYTYLILFGLATTVRFYRTDWLKVRMKTTD